MNPAITGSTIVLASIILFIIFAIAGNAVLMHTGGGQIIGNNTTRHPYFRVLLLKG